MQKKEYSVEIGGKTLTAIFTDLAEQAQGSVILKYGETIVLATACMSHDKQEGLGFFNLTVDYLEKFYAAGKILGSRFVRREGRPSEEAILACRAIDRTLRPLFDQSIRHAVQVMVTVLSVDGTVGGGMGVEVGREGEGFVRIFFFFRVLLLRQ